MVSVVVATTADVPAPLEATRNGSSSPVTLPATTESESGPTWNALVPEP
jgi:hypothetical protein